jgi:hypothetical protein
VSRRLSLVTFAVLGLSVACTSTPTSPTQPFEAGGGSIVTGTTGASESDEGAATSRTDAPGDAATLVVLTGVIRSIEGEPPFLTLVVDGRTVKTIPRTVVTINGRRARLSQLRVGMDVRVLGVRRDAALVAREIRARVDRP